MEVEADTGTEDALLVAGSDRDCDGTKLTARTLADGSDMTPVVALVAARAEYEAEVARDAEDLDDDCRLLIMITRYSVNLGLETTVRLRSLLLTVALHTRKNCA